MPKVVDHEQRRRDIAEAVFRVIGERGMEGVSLRDVATAAGVSMGSVQQYFGTKEEMLRFALGYMRERAGVRFSAELGKLKNPSNRDHLRAILRTLLPTNSQSRQEATVNIAFFSISNGNKEFRRVLADGYSQLLAACRQQLANADLNGELQSGIDVDAEAATLFFATQGLIGPVLIGSVSTTRAMAVLDHQLDRIFVPV